MTGSTLTSPGEVLVVCIGNELVADDAAGYEVFQRLAALEPPPWARVEYVAVGGIALLDRLTGEESGLIVVDAVQFGAPAGTIHSLSWEDIPSHSSASISAHSIGLNETIEVGRLLYPEKIPPAIRLVGIEGRCFNRMRDRMTTETAAALDDATSCVMQMINQLRNGA